MARIRPHRKKAAAAERAEAAHRTAPSREKQGDRQTTAVLELNGKNRKT